MLQDCFSKSKEKIDPSLSRYEKQTIFRDFSLFIRKTQQADRILSK